MRRTIRRLGSTNRYTDGSGRKLESDSLPKDLYIDSISNRAYPVRGEHWQPVVASAPSPHKGNVVVSGAGVVGLTVAAQFALRGWHTTVVERGPSVSQLFSPKSAASPGGGYTDAGSSSPNGGDDEGMQSAAAARDTESANVNAFNGAVKVGHYCGPLLRPHYTNHNNSSSNSGDGKKDGAAGPSSLLSSSSPTNPFIELECALVTRRAADALETAGVRVQEIRHLGVPVSGVMDHPGAYNSWLTRGLVEHHPFAVKMLSMDMLGLRRHLEHHVTTAMPNNNLQVFYGHVVEAVFPLRQQVVVRPWEGSAAQRTFLSDLEDTAAAGAGNISTSNSRSSSSTPVVSSSQRDMQAQTDAAVASAKQHKKKRLETSLTMSSVKWDAKFSDEAVDYDLLISAEGANSHLRDLLDVEGFAADIDLCTRWFLLRADRLSHQHAHRWLHERRTRPVQSAASYHVRSAAQVPVAMAFPRVEGTNLFSVMVYGPVGEIAGLCDADVLARFLPDVAAGDANAELVSFTRAVRPAPTIYCENFYNSVGLPSAVLVGDAGHTCNPFWMQGLALGLEDGVNLLNQVDAYSRHFFDAVKQYSDERGANGDALREITDRCLFYERKKHVNPLIRFRNSYQHFMNVVFPRSYNNYYEGSTNHLYAKTIEEMLNGRGYTSFDFAEKQQAKHRSFYHFGRLYT